MNKIFNLSRYKELVKLEESNNYSIFDKNFLELLNYRASITREINYNRRNDYFFLIDQYLSQRIKPYDFRSKFLVMLKVKEDSREAFRMLEDFAEL